MSAPPGNPKEKPEPKPEPQGEPQPEPTMDDEKPNSCNDENVRSCNNDNGEFILNIFNIAVLYFWSQLEITKLKISGFTANIRLGLVKMDSVICVLQQLKCLTPVKI